MDILIRNFKNFVYLLLWFFIGFLYFAFYLISITFSVGISFTVVGLPILAGVFQTIPFLLDLDRRGAENYTNINIPRLKWLPQDKVTKEISDKRNWFAVGIMIFPRFFLGFLTFLAAFICYVLPITMILSAFLYRLFDISFMMIAIDTLPRAIVACIAGILLLLLLSRLAGKIVRWAGSYTGSIIEVIRRWR